LTEAATRPALNVRFAPLAGWGRYPVVECRFVEPDSAEEVDQYLSTQTSPVIARGYGRSYGDSSLSPECTLITRRLDRMLAFDCETGTLTCEGGTLLSDVIDTFLPRGWFAPVTPGTKFVTVGGMIASDVHGKNHHSAGSFCDHVTTFDLATGDGNVLTCSRSEHADLFAATCGGMGLTGVILRATFGLLRVGSSRIEQTIIRAPDLESAMETFERHAQSTYSVAWIDCFASGAKLGRSVVFLGEHAGMDTLPKSERIEPYTRKTRRPKRFPFDLPGFLLNRASVSMFNSFYYRLQRPGTTLVDLGPYFYPLDAIHDWNRMYGARGFVQYQCVLPLCTSRTGLVELLTEIARAGIGSFLAVLKRLGRRSFGYLSFPIEGYTLAMDFPVKPETFELLARLDGIVARHGGRIYLTKDARTSAQVIAAGYPELHAFREVRRRYGLEARFQSIQSRRLEL
jgi:decaprenylphospho-beta-D-ribofuranose 2-oxidase